MTASNDASYYLKQLKLIEENIHFDKVRLSNPLLGLIEQTMPMLNYCLQKFFVAQSIQFPSIGVQPLIRLKTLQDDIKNIISKGEQMDIKQLQTLYKQKRKQKQAIINKFKQTDKRQITLDLSNYDNLKQIQIKDKQIQSLKEQIKRLKHQQKKSCNNQQLQQKLKQSLIKQSELKNKMQDDNKRLLIEINEGLAKDKQKSIQLKQYMEKIKQMSEEMRSTAENLKQKSIEQQQQKQYILKIQKQNEQLFQNLKQLKLIANNEQTLKLNNQLNQLQQQQRENQITINQLNKLLEVRQQQIIQLRKQIDYQKMKFSKQLEEENIKITKLTASIVILQTKLKQEQLKYTDLLNKTAQIQNSQQQLKARILKLEEEIHIKNTLEHTKHAELSELEAKIDQLTQQNTTLNQQLNQQKHKNGNLLQQLNELEDKISDQQNSEEDDQQDNQQDDFDQQNQQIQ